MDYGDYTLKGVQTKISNWREEEQSSRMQQDIGENRTLNQFYAEQRENGLKGQWGIAKILHTPFALISPSGYVSLNPSGKGPFPTRSSGVQFVEGRGNGIDLHQNVTGVRVMDDSGNHKKRTIYFKRSGFGDQTLDHEKGKTPVSEPFGHLYHDPKDRPKK